MDRVDCVHFEYKRVEGKGKRVKIPSCKIGKMRGIGGCEDYCEWFALVEPDIPEPPMHPEPPEPIEPP